MKLNRAMMIAVGVVIALIAAAAAAPFLIPAGQYRAGLEKAASDSLGRAVKINGALRFSVFPVLGLNAEQVTVANLPGGKAPLFANIDNLDVGVAVAPLLGGDVQIRKLVLKKPTLALEADAGGKANWVFEAAQAPGEDGRAPEQAAKLDRIGLGDVRIIDGALTYRDKMGKVQALSALNAKVSLKSLDDPFALDSEFTYGGDPVKLTLTSPAARAFTEGKTTPLNLLIASEKLAAKLDGAIDPADFALTGKLEANGPSLRKLAAWMGSPIGEGGGMGAFGVNGDLTARGPVTRLANAAIAIDKAKGRGDLTITAPDGAPPHVGGVLALDSLDVNPYLAPPPTTAGAADPAKGVNVQQGWGADKIDLSGLKAINADLALTTGPLLFQKMKIDRSVIDVALKDGVLRATMKQLALYGGAGAGVLTLDGRGQGLKLQNTLKVSGINAKAFLTDAIGFERIEGKANIDMAISGAGETQQAVMNTLAGSAKFAFEDGALVGVNLAQVARQIQAVLTGAAVGPAAKTDFAELAASFAIARGVAHTNDLRLLNPFVRIAGTGDISFAAQTLNMKITPTVVKSIEGQGGAADLGGVSVPFRVTGPWAKPAFAPDLAGVVQSRINEELNKVLPEGLGGLGSLFGGKKPQ